MKRNKLSLFSIPYVVWMAIFVVIPILMVVVYAFSSAGGGFTLDNFARIWDYAVVFTRSFKLALIATVICLLVGYPISCFLAREGAGFQRVAMMLIMLPMWMNFLLRTYAWMSLLETNGIINTLLSKLGLPALQIMYTEKAVILGMVYNFLPFMIYPIYNTLQKMDHSLIEAAQDLGANPSQVFIKAVFPLSMPGVMSGIMMVFMPTISTFAIAELLTMNNIKLFGTTIQENINNGMWNYGAALSLIMLLLIGITGLFSNESSDSANEGGLI